jgi:hypothetical protein
VSAVSGEGGNFEVEVDPLLQGGVNIAHITDTVHSITRDLWGDVQEHWNAGGTGQIAAGLKVSYEPTRDDSFEFLRMLTRSLDAHGTRTIDLGHGMNDVNDITADLAGNGDQGPGQPGAPTGGGRKH